MQLRYKIVLSAFVGLFMGFILPKLAFYTFFTTTPLAMIPWGIVGVLLSFLALNKLQSVLICVTYMIFLVESFLFLGHLKFSEELFNVILFLVIMLVVAIIAGTIMGLIAFYLRKLLNK